MRIAVLFDRCLFGRGSDDKSTGRENVSLVEPLTGRRGRRGGEEGGEIFRRSSSIRSARGHLGPRSALLSFFFFYSRLFRFSFVFSPRFSTLETMDYLTRRVDAIDLGCFCSKQLVIDNRMIFGEKFCFIGRISISISFPRNLYVFNPLNFNIFRNEINLDWKKVKIRR